MFGRLRGSKPVANGDLNRSVLPTSPAAYGTFLSPSRLKSRIEQSFHPYLSGNYAPLPQATPLTPCSYTGVIPKELWGGQYVRNGGNPVTNEDLGRDAHWFDGDGMLCGVSFQKTRNDVRPEFVNQYVLTDVLLSSTTSPRLRKPITPSVSTLVNPLTTLLSFIFCVLRTLVLVLLSYLPGSSQVIKRISVANTSVIFHDGRALATCESGPPMRVTLPSLGTVGWYNGKKAEGETDGDEGLGFGGSGLFGFMREWTTGHPRVDPRTSELLLFHSTFVPPYIRYSIVPATFQPCAPSTPLDRPILLLNTPILGVTSPKLMHDFGVSLGHTVILDLPLSLDPLNLVRGKPPVSYSPTEKSRFGVFPRYEPEKVRWFETSACCIFHTANTWDSSNKLMDGTAELAVNMLACRLTSASLVHKAGNLPVPVPVRNDHSGGEEQCRLYYYQFNLSASPNLISHQWALSAIPFEFPSVRDDKSMTAARYIYGCSTSLGTFDAALGRTAKIDILVKIDAQNLIDRGLQSPQQQITGCIDNRSVAEIMDSQDPHDAIKVFVTPPGWFAQECRFIPRQDGSGEDDGWLLAYVFDESQLDAFGGCKPGASSELWIIDAQDMKTITGKVLLPRRVPYGLHANWFPEAQILKQRPAEKMRSVLEGNRDVQRGLWMALRRRIEEFIG